jgi:hypothetical protein
MKILKSFKIFEAIYSSIIGVSEYNLVYDPTTQSAWFKFTSTTNETYEMEIKSNGIHKDGRVREMRVFSPNNFKFNFDNLSEKFLYIANKNKLGYKFKLHSVEYPKYGLLPYGIVTMDPILNSMEDLERIFASTKTVNKKVKRNDLDQFTF